MRVYDIASKKSDQMFAFEIDAWLGRRLTAKVISKIKGVNVLRGPRFLSWFREEEFCEFELQGQQFKIWEPFGDNSRYWIGPDDGIATPASLTIRQAFVDYTPWFSRRIKLTTTR